MFVLRLEDKEIVHQTIESFAADRRIINAEVSIIGAADKGSRLVVGPKKGDDCPPIPMEHVLQEVHEMTGVGTIFADKDERPVLHMHVACGRKDAAVAGCVRKGVIVWKTAEVIIREITGANARRELDATTGFDLLNPRRPRMTDLSRVQPE